MAGTGGRVVEREPTLAVLAPHVDAAAQGRGRLIFLGGEAGVGKTTLCAAFLETAGQRLRVRRGYCDNLTTAAALGPLAEAVPELGDAVESTPHEHRLRLFRRLRDQLIDVPTLLLLEDVHWADEATVEFLRFLGRRLVEAPLLVLATYRSEEATKDHPLGVLRGDLATSPGVGQVELMPLTEAGVRQLVEAAGSTLDSGQLHRSTGGNPFYVTELIALGEQRLPPTVRDAVLARASRLSPPARRVLAAAAVLAQRADVALLLAVADRPGAAVDECVESGMLVGGAGGWTFRHDLARMAIEDTLSPAARQQLHAAALAALTETGSPDDRRLAHHAAGSGDRAGVLAYAPRAAERAARLGAHREAAQLYRLALDWAGPGDEEARLYEALSYECYLIDQLDEARTARLAALARWQAVGDRAAVGVAQRWLSRLSWFLGCNADSERYAALAIETLAPLGDSAELAMAYSNLAQLRMLADDLDGTLEWGTQAITLARRVGARDVEIHALNNVGTVAWMGSETAQGRADLTRSLDLALAADAHEHAARAYTNLATAPVINRRYAEADRYLRAGIDYCRDRDLDSWRLYMTAWQARSFAEQGRVAEADAGAREVLRYPQLSAIARIPATVVAAQLAIRRGEDASALLAEAQALAAPTGEAQRIVPVALARAEAAWVAGRPDEICVAVDAVWDLAAVHPRRWDIGELRWWSTVAGRPRDASAAAAAPFDLMLAGEWLAAAEEWESVGCPQWTAVALLSSPDLGAARRGLELIDALGLPAIRTALVRDRHAQGLPIPRGPRPVNRGNAFGLTARELEVLVLVAQGCTNAEVAQRLFLSEKTVGHHVSAVLHKLGEPTRARAVAAALRQGVVRPT